MKIIATITFCLLLVFHLAGQVYINEIDYDQPSTDALEFIELVGQDGTSLNGYTIELVNGSNGSVYNTLDLTGMSIPNDNISGYGFFVIGPASGVANVDYTPSGWTDNQIQNGSPDGILLKLSGVVVDGFSYEGEITNNSDFTTGMQIAATEDNNSPNLSIGRILLGFDANNQDQYFAQTAETPSPGEINTAHGQTLGGDPPPNIFNIARTPRIPDANQNTTVSADVTDNGFLNSVELRFTINDGAMQSAAMTNTGGNTWSADIPESAYNDADRVGFWIWAQDDAPQSSESDTVNFFAGITPISDIHAIDSDGILLYDGYDARVAGVATVDNGTFSSSSLDVYMQDASAGINVFSFNVDTSFSFIAGNNYTVVGVIDQYNGKTELTPSDTSGIIDNGPDTLPSPVVRTIAELLANGETYEGMLVAILQVDNTGNGDPWPAAGSNANVEITDDGGTSLLILRIDLDTDIDGSPEPNWPVNVAGVFGQFDSSVPYTEGYQLQPRSTDDIDIAVGIEPVAGLELPKKFELGQNYPNPFNPTTNLNFQVTDFRFVSLKIYDALGREAATLVNEPKAPGVYRVQWDASDFSSGVYYVRMRVLDNKGVEHGFVKSRKIILMK